MNWTLKEMQMITNKIKTEQCWECMAVGREEDFYTIIIKDQTEYYCSECRKTVKVEG